MCRHEKFLNMSFINTSSDEDDEYYDVPGVYDRWHVDNEQAAIEANIDSVRTTELRMEFLRLYNFYVKQKRVAQDLIEFLQNKNKCILESNRQLNVINQKLSRIANIFNTVQVFLFVQANDHILDLNCSSVCMPANHDQIKQEELVELKKLNHFCQANHSLAHCNCIGDFRLF